jgi:hypothetical protein
MTANILSPLPFIKVPWLLMPHLTIQLSYLAVWVAKVVVVAVAVAAVVAAVIVVKIINARKKINESLFKNKQIFPFKTKDFEF